MAGSLRDGQVSTVEAYNTNNALQLSVELTFLTHNNYHVSNLQYFNDAIVFDVQPRDDGATSWFKDLLSNLDSGSCVCKPFK